MNVINNKIISRFYVITLNQKPVYVGYTNRPIEQRFNEHKRDKDFGKIKPEIEQIAQLEYPFTWDTNKIDQYAKEVNDKECELIKQFNTQNSKYQKANGGGQNWADIKYFINTNHNNPKFLNMAEADVLKRIENEHNINKYLMGFQRVNTDVSIHIASFIKNMDNSPTQYMIDFIYHMGNPATQYMKSFISNMHNPTTIYINNYISNMHNPTTIYINNYINNMTDPSTQYMNNFTNSIKEPVTQYIADCINSIKEPVTQYMKSFISNMNNPATRYINDCINDMKEPTSQYMKSFVTSMHNPPTQYMISFITNMH